MAACEPSLVARLRVAEVLRRWPWVCEVFRHHGMICPGCPMAEYASVAEAARACDVDPEDLSRAIAAVVARIDTARCPD